MDTFNFQNKRIAPTQFSRNTSSSVDYAQLQLHQPEDNYLIMNKMPNTPRPIRRVGKDEKPIVNFPGRDEQVYEEISNETRFKCSRCSLLVSILNFGIILVCVALLSIYIVKVEMLQKEFSQNPLIGVCTGVTSDLCELFKNTFKELNKSSEEMSAENFSDWKELMAKQDGCSDQFVLQETPPENFVEPNSRFHVVKGWSDSSNKYKPNRHCIEPNDDYSKFKVMEEGTYFFFSQLSYYGTHELLERAYKKHLFAGQKVFSDDHEMLQQSSMVSVPRLEEGQPMPGCGLGNGSLHVSTLTGIIDLEAGESFTIHVVPITWLCRQNSASSFGVFRIG